jgi:CelD/BcsL family acetyltransferase involved in cellulose biosynthesis
MTLLPPPAALLDAQLARGTAAEQLLNDPAFLEAWANLASACPWATGCQSWEFAKAWYPVYRGRFDPLLLFQRDSRGRLIGLFPLAIEAASNTLVHVGAHQAEYQVWISSEADSDVFIEDALNLLSIRYPGQRLRLKYLPSGVPLGWRTPGRRWRQHSILQEHSCPQLATGGDSSVDKSLKKRGTRSKINRLKRSGALTFVHIQTRTEFERIINTVADFYDLRQGAISPSTPFRDDPRKKEFMLRLLEKPGLAHASVLMLDEKPIAANIGVVGRTFVSIGVFGYSPFYGESSPGRMHILLLGQYLRNNGVQQIDLTPGGGSYKDQLADGINQVYVLSVHFGRITHAVQAGKAAILTLLKWVLSRSGTAITMKARNFVVDPMGSLQSIVYGRGQLRSLDAIRRCYELDISSVRQTHSEHHFQVNSISDLLLYRPSRKFDPSRRAFFEYAWKRLEAGDRVYTLARDSTLMHCAWLRLPAKVGSSNMESSNTLFPNACLLWDSYTHPEGNKKELMKSCLARRAHDAAEIHNVAKVLIEINPADLKLLNDAGIAINREYIAAEPGSMAASLGQ